MNKLCCLFLCLPLLAADPTYTKALEQASHGDCAAAVATLSSSLKSNADAGPESYRLLAYCHRALGQFPEGIRAARAGLAKHPASPTLELTLGRLLVRQKPDDPEAGTLLARAANALPKDPEARHYYAQWAYFNNRDSVCVQQETQALRIPGIIDPALIQMNTLLGMCASRMEAIPQAKAAFERAMAVNERQTVFDPESAYEYLKLLNRLAEDGDARRVTTRILGRAPTFAPALLEEAKQLDRAGEPEKAIEAAHSVLRALEMAPPNPNNINTQRAAHMILAKSYTILGKDAEAKNEQMWIEQHPNPESPR